ncbi:DUF1684 domain-containing protein [Marinicella sediminis]|uniref:DUF1684 domain-containing protein n=1 Tax=Marinicella sediminis TaxID=1792834 RepID=A0ABV7JFL1_9GAMM|nr:DUF1684 domain-containing protein [Marinicella sediminis]
MIRLLITSFLLTTSINTQAQPQEYLDWKDGRLERLTQPHGWLSLVGLEWLYTGDNRIGAAADNDIVLSHGPDYLGNLQLSADSSMRFVPVADSGIMANGEPLADTIDVFADTSEQVTTEFTIGSFLFYVVERDKMAFRIKDARAPTRIDFKGLDYFPYDPDLRIVARFVPYEPAKIIPTVNVLGVLNDSLSPGRLEFNIAGKSYSLDALDSDNAYYMIFADRTNGRSTYGPGRFVYTDGKVNEQGEVVIDFNKAYNPPCAFTAYSTCTLPPRQNRLPVFIEAGERKYANSVY